jgi:hypothetical protein
VKQETRKPGTHIPGFLLEKFAHPADAYWHRRCLREGVKKSPFHPKLDPLGVKVGLELAAAGIAAMLLMRWFGM